MPVPKRAGRLADHPLAAEFADVVHRIHRRYAAEVVAAFDLCPHLKDVETGFGELTVVIDSNLDTDLLLTIARGASVSVSHVMYPLYDGPSKPFERFASATLATLRKASRSAPVMAVFHPEMSGDTVNPYRLVGLLRHAPDPFVQFVPDGLHQGGTVMNGMAEPGVDNAERNYAHVMPALIERVLAAQASIKADRDASYAPFLAAFAAI